jgi:putative phosphoesterase
MKIGIVSDTHGRTATVERALELLRGRGVELVLHCGDIDDPETVQLFRGMPTHFVFGNCDHERDAIRAAVAEIGAALHEPWGFLELEGRKIGWLHGDDHRLKCDVERSGACDYLFYGHTHQRADERHGPTRVVNPGALHRASRKTCLVLDLATGEFEEVVVG